MQETNELEKAAQRVLGRRVTELMKHNDVLGPICKGSVSFKPWQEGMGSKLLLDHFELTLDKVNVGPMDVAAKHVKKELLCVWCVFFYFVCV